MSPMSQDYELVEQVKTDGDIPLTLYRNKITGLKIAIGNVECPIVKCEIALATEAFDDDGLPHTLEHLVFLGSEDYPYKGVLDLIANKCLADGTNAMTDTDYTVYQVSTAGSDGVLQLLPVYLDHLLYPTLTDAGYTTEVHHINGEGENAGVVYCEMQARENTGESRCHLEMLRSMYPGRCGYRSETGGLMANLRTSTNNTKVRNFHKQFYHAKNMCVVITGPVEAQDIFKAIKPIEDKIVSKRQHEMEFDRPWQTPVEPLPGSVQRTIRYSCDSDDDGIVDIGFRGPSAVDNFHELVAVQVLLEYLNSTAISPIQRDFVECDEPYCSSVSHSIIENSISCIYLSFESVGKQYLGDVCNRFMNLLKNIRDGEEKLDMDRMRTILSRAIVRTLSIAETSPHQMISALVIGHFLYGKDSLKSRSQEIPIYEGLAKHESNYWLDLLHRYFTGPEARYVCIVGEPSPELMQAMSDKEKQRIARQREELKEELPKLAEILRQSIRDNEKPAPSDMLKSVSVPSTDNIKFHSLERVVIDSSKTPFRLQYDSIKTNFITIQVCFDTSHGLSKQDRLFLPLLSEIYFESPIERNGEIIPYERVVAELYSDTITYGSGIGLSSSSACSVGACSMLFSVAMQVELSKYDKAVNWCRELIYKTIYTPERLKTVATRMISDISQYKRSGGKVVSSMTNALIFQSNSNQWASNFMRLQKFLKKLVNRLKDEPELVQKDINRIRDHLARPNNFFVHLSLNKDKVNVGKIHEPWMSIVPEHILESTVPKSHIQFNNITPCKQLVDTAISPKAAIVGVGSVESNYMQQLVRTIDDPMHPDLPALRVLIQYMTQLEGPLWRQIRGLGLSYHYSIAVSPAEGLMYLILYKSTQLVAAYSKMIEIVNRYVDGEEDYEDNLFESAKSVLIFEFIAREKSAAGKSQLSLMYYVRNLDINYNKEFIKRIVSVTKEDLRRVGAIYLKPLFEDPERRTTVCCHTSKVEEVSRGLDSLNCKVTAIKLEEEPLLNAIG